ncbi:hypothetical protein CHS0354_022054 [Potamilus streckersoni]|uniref:Endoplasmic reticulum junction formation protein lunapark n=1 Tax=Potamilus streckersoni TaxID=2493646 RepID=A0AAE0SRX6_9BIVA|nr:hypothetical protein CHS0354_022054 [Potamilus streckersoni]
MDFCSPEIKSRKQRKKTTIEVLEEIEKDIQGLQKVRRKDLDRQKRFIGGLVIYSIGLYVIAALVFFFLFFPQGWKDRLIYSSPLLVFPFLVWITKKVLHWYYIKRIMGTDSALEELKERKKSILEDVMENETYKKAKEILEKYDPERYKQLEHPKASPEKIPTSGTDLRQRNVLRQPTPGSVIRPQITPVIQGTSPVRPLTTPHIGPTGMQPRNIMAVQHNGYGAPRGPPLPRPLIPHERSSFERLLDILVGDGPENKYALICKVCHSHNGMALKEEFEYLTFRCCYCHTLNPALKHRPSAPRIEPLMQQPNPEEDDVTKEEGEEDVNKNAGEDEDDENNEDKGDNPDIETISDADDGDHQQVEKMDTDGADNIENMDIDAVKNKEVK